MSPSASQYPCQLERMRRVSMRCRTLICYVHWLLPACGLETIDCLLLKCVRGGCFLPLEFVVVVSDGQWRSIWSTVIVQSWCSASYIARFDLLAFCCHRVLSHACFAPLLSDQKKKINQPTKGRQDPRMAAGREYPKRPTGSEDLRAEKTIEEPDWPLKT
eukprot:6461280-Amphidinium_carterae.2